MQNYKKKFIFFIFIFLFSFSFSINYSVKFVGLKDPSIIEAIENVSNLFIFKNRAPRSVNALRQRADGDLDNILKTLYAFGFFDANVAFDIEDIQNNFTVNIFCDLGPRYLLHDYEICLSPCDDLNCNKLDIELEKLQIKLNTSTDSKRLNQIKNNILFELAEIGYPLAKIDKYKVIADKLRKVLDVKTCVDKGPYSKFGTVSIVGLKNISPKFIDKKLDWKESDQYSPAKVSETHMRLLETNLFSSVSITHQNKLDDDGLLPIKIHVIEAKHQNISLGVNYATVDGPGGFVGYHNYNLGSMGETFSFKLDFSKRTYTGNIFFKKPDLFWYNQALTLSAYIKRENIRPYLAFTYGGVTRITHVLNKYFLYSYGARLDLISVNSSANNGKYFIFGLPVYLRLTTSNHLLNPTRGYNLAYIFTPNISVAERKTRFLKQRLIQEFYLPASKSEILTFALRLELGSIIGPSVYKIPMTMLFLNGSDDDLRGYRYKTVGPRDGNNNPIGGKSAILLSFEPRLRISKTIGIVPFMDLGNISVKQMPQVKGKWRKSLGIGLRYFTFFGPLRLDVGFPLNRYESSDPKYRVYISIGQSF